MDFKLKKLALYSLPLFAATTIIGCGGSNDGVTEEKNYATLHYLRKDGQYDEWGVHAYKNDSCKAVLNDTTWDSPILKSSENTEAGAVYKIEIDPEQTCINYIIHKGDEKEAGDDHSWQLADGHALYVAQGNPDADSEPVPLALFDAEKAIFINETTIALPASFDSSLSYKLLYSASAAIQYNDKMKTVSGEDASYALSFTELSEATKAQYKHLSSYQAVELDLDAIDIQTLLKGQLHITASSDEGIEFATGLQLAPVLDVVYSSAKDAELGAILKGGETSFKLWAPTAQSVNLLINNESIALTEDSDTGVWSYTSSSDHSGEFYQYEVSVYHPYSRQVVTSTTTDPYSLSLSSNSLKSQVIDLSDAANTELAPTGWDSHEIPSLAHSGQHIIYETHLRDLSVSDTMGTRAYDGKYLAITEEDRESTKQLMALKEAGMNTIHLLNVFDIATVNEDESKRFNLDSTVKDFCDSGVNGYAQICQGADAASTSTFKELLTSFDPTTDAAQSLMNDLRAHDSFNWGYDPFHYTAPEGSYATDPEGTVRIKEYRQMIQSLHEMGYRVVMDVVYNHTNDGGLGEKSVLDKIVPGYYQRLNANGGIEASTCCSNTATENTMMGKLMIDSLLVWAKDYKIDGFRFDLMGHQPKELMVDAWKQVKTIDEDSYFYGEGWNFGEVANNARFVQATQLEMAGTGIGTYSDRLRDAMRGGSPFDSGDNIRLNQGFANAAEWNEMVDEKGNTGDELIGEDRAVADLLHATDLIRLGMAGNLQNFVLLDHTGETKRGYDVDYNGQPAAYTLAPQENVSYVSKHDNQTLWDNNMYKAATSLDSAQRAQMQIVALSAPLLGQGIPFLHLGSELLRSKSMQRDSYDSGDWFNAVKFDMSENNWNVGLPRKDKDGDNWTLIKTILADSNAKPSSADIMWTDERFKELLKIRSSSPLFSLETAADVKKRIDFRNVGAEQLPGLIVMTIDDGSSVADLDAEVDAIVVIINALNKAQEFTIEGAEGFELHPALADSTATFLEGTFSVPAISTAVFVAAQGDAQGTGLPVDSSNKDYSQVPPLDYTVELLLNNDANAMEFIGNYEYKVVLELDAGEHSFSFNHLDTTNAVLKAGDFELSNDAGVLSFTAVEAGYYEFYLKAEDIDALEVKVLQGEDPAPYGETELYLRGSISNPNWDPVETAKFTYAGKSIYELTFDVSATASAMKIADAQWSAGTNFGASGTLALDTAIILEEGSSSPDMAVTLPAGSYLFSLNASNPTAPVLTVTAAE